MGVFHPGTSGLWCRKTTRNLAPSPLWWCAHRSSPTEYLSNREGTHNAVRKMDALALPCCCLMCKIFFKRNYLLVFSTTQVSPLLHSNADKSHGYYWNSSFNYIQYYLLCWGHQLHWRCVVRGFVLSGPQLCQISKDHKPFRIKSSFALCATSLYVNTPWSSTWQQRKERHIGFLHELTPYPATSQTMISDHVRKVTVPAATKCILLIKRWAVRKYNHNNHSSFCCQDRSDS